MADSAEEKDDEPDEIDDRREDTGQTDTGQTDTGREDTCRQYTRRETFLSIGGLAFATGAWVTRPAPVSASPGWAQGVPLPASRGEMKVAVIDDQIYVPGGMTGPGTATDRFEIFDPVADEWLSGSPLPRALDHHGTEALDGTLYVMGGLERFDQPPSTAAYAYDPTVDEWEELPALPDGRSGHEAFAWNGRIYLLGGVPESDDRIDTLVFDPATQEWERRTPIPTRREHVAGAAIEEGLLIVGGRWNGSPTDAVAVYDPDEDEWHERTPLPTARSGFGAAVIDGKVYVAGGEKPAFIGGWTTATLERYDPVADSWDRLPAMPLRLHGNGVAAVGDELFVLGGSWRQGLLSITSWSDRTFVFDPQNPEVAGEVEGDVAGRGG